MPRYNVKSRIYLAILQQITSHTRPQKGSGKNISHINTVLPGAPLQGIRKLLGWAQTRARCIGVGMWIRAFAGKCPPYSLHLFRAQVSSADKNTDFELWCFNREYLLVFCSYALECSAYTDAADFLRLYPLHDITHRRPSFGRPHHRPRCS